MTYILQLLDSFHKLKFLDLKSIHLYLDPVCEPRTLLHINTKLWYTLSSNHALSDSLINPEVVLISLLKYIWDTLNSSLLLLQNLFMMLMFLFCWIILLIILIVIELDSFLNLDQMNGQTRWVVALGQCVPWIQ